MIFRNPKVNNASVTTVSVLNQVSPEWTFADCITYNVKNREGYVVSEKKKKFFSCYFKFPCTFEFYFFKK